MYRGNMLLVEEFSFPFVSTRGCLTGRDQMPVKIEKNVRGGIHHDHASALFILDIFEMYSATSCSIAAWSNLRAPSRMTSSVTEVSFP